MSIDDYSEIVAMNINDKEGVFSSSWMSLQLQLKGLLEGAGGEQALSLLDSLCSLSNEEQRIVIRIFVSTIQRVAKSDTHLQSEEERTMKEIEDSLVEQIMSAIHTSHAEENNGPKQRKFSVLNGGKSNASQDENDLPPSGPRPRTSKVRHLPFIA